MAKGLRATSRKRNKTNLRATIFGPAHDARTERLSAKLQELAAKPRPVQEKATDVDVEQDKGQIEKEDPTSSGTHDEMEIDAQDANMKLVKSGSNKKSRPSRTEKKIAKRKAKSSIVFAPNAGQRKRLEAKGRKT